MNEAETRAELIDPKLKASGWGVVDDTKVLREYKITAGKIQTYGGRAKPLIAGKRSAISGQPSAFIGHYSTKAGKRKVRNASFVLILWSLLTA